MFCERVKSRYYISKELVSGSDLWVKMSFAEGKEKEGRAAVTLSRDAKLKLNLNLKLKEEE